MCVHTGGLTANNSAEHALAEERKIRKAIMIAKQNEDQEEEDKENAGPNTPQQQRRLQQRSLLQQL